MGAAPSPDSARSGPPGPAEQLSAQRFLRRPLARALEDAGIDARGLQVSWDDEARAWTARLHGTPLASALDAAGLLAAVRRAVTRSAGFHLEAALLHGWAETVGATGLERR